jgi:hypothetical protein
MRTITILLGFVVLLVGCYTLSIDPLYFEEDLVFDPSLVGIWGDTESADGGTWTFLSRGGKSYQLVTTEDDESDGVFEAHLLRAQRHD